MRWDDAALPRACPPPRRPPVTSHASSPLPPSLSSQECELFRDLLTSFQSLYKEVVPKWNPASATSTSSSGASAQAGAKPTAAHQALALDLERLPDPGYPALLEAQRRAALPPPSMPRQLTAVHSGGGAGAAGGRAAPPLPETLHPGLLASLASVCLGAFRPRVRSSLLNFAQAPRPCSLWCAAGRAAAAARARGGRAGGRQGRVGGRAAASPCRGGPGVAPRGVGRLLRGAAAAGVRGHAVAAGPL